jgi:DNA protecting protein DprA
MSDRNLVYWLWLGQLPDVGVVMQKRLLKKFSSPLGVYQASKEQLLQLPGLGPILVGRILMNKSLDTPLRILEKMDRHEMKLLTLDDPHYPDLAKEVDKSPIYLYYRGSLKKDSTGIAIIGTRRCTPYGRQVAIEAASYLAERSVPVISGLAKGIDGYAHTACLRAEGYTLAILGCGLDLCYPRDHRGLMNRILEKGALLSPYPPGTPIHPKHFHLRNYLISAWSHKILVVEASETSGSLAVPNQIYVPESKGVNLLIASGATIFLHPQQLLPSSSPTPTPSNEQNPPEKHRNKVQELTKESISNPLEREIYNKLVQSPHIVDQLLVQLRGSRTEVLEALSIMELKDIIQIGPDGMVKLLRR